MSTSEEIARRAKQMDLEVKYGTSSGSESQIEVLTRYVQVLDAKINLLMEKVDSMAAGSSKAMNSTHEKILEMLWDWRSTSELAELMGYRQEHVSRLISEMRRAGLVQERRDGKKIFYKRTE